MGGGGGWGETFTGGGKSWVGCPTSVCMHAVSLYLGDYRLISWLSVITGLDYWNEL